MKARSVNEMFDIDKYDLERESNVLPIEEEFEIKLPLLIQKSLDKGMSLGDIKRRINAQLSNIEYKLRNK